MMDSMKNLNRLGLFFCVILLLGLTRISAQNCDTALLPFSENFESYTAMPYGSVGVVPNCWNLITNGSQQRYFPHVSREIVYEFDGNYLLITAANKAELGMRNYVILPYINVDLNELHIAFDYKMQNQYVSTFLILGYITDVDDESTFVGIDTIESRTTVIHQDYSLYHKQIPIGARLAFCWHNSSTVSMNCVIDNIYVDFETCVPISELSVDSVAMHSANLKWTHGREESLWRIEYGEAGYAHGQEDTVIWASEPEFKLSDLVQGKTYELYVQAVCHEDNLSDYSDSVVFTAYCFEMGDTTNDEVCGVYNWRGKDYDQSGFYYDTIANAAQFGCDSIYCLNLISHPIYNQYDTVVLCDNEFPYYWRDTVFQADSLLPDYVFVRKADFGCDSIVNLHFIVNPPYYREDTLTICQSQLPYAYNDTIFGIDTHTGRYLINRMSSTGCDSITSLNLFVTVSYHQTEIVRICEQDLPYPWRDTIFDEGTTTEVYTFNRTSQLNCDSIVDLMLLVRPSYHQHEYLTLCRSELPYQWRDIIIPTNMISGTMTISTQAETGCDSITYLHVTINSLIEEEETISICAEELPYSWRDTVFQVGTRSGNYTVWTPNDACGVKSVLHLTVRPKPAVYKTVTICRNELPYAIADTIFDENTASGDYTLRLVSETSCDSALFLRLTVMEAQNLEETYDICRNELPFVVSDTTFNERTVTGDYVVSRYMQNGCSYTITIHLNVHENYEFYDTLSICASELPTIWNGHVIARGTVSDDYVYSATTLAGCDSIWNLHLIVYPTYRMMEELTICQQDLPYPWRDTIFEVGSLNGMYLFERTSSMGCDSLVFLKLIINDSKYIDEYLTVCANDLPFDWRDTIFDIATVSDEYVFNKQTIHGCDSIVTLHLIVNPSYELDEYLTVCSRNLPYPWRDTVFTETTESGIYTFVRHSSEGCDSIVHLNLTINPAFVQEYEDTICENNLPWYWNDTIFERGTISGTYTFNYITDLGCDSIIILHLIVNPSFEDTLSLEICQNDLPYFWDVENYTFPVGANSGIIPFMHESVNGCDSTIYLNLTIHPQYNLMEEVEVCENEFPFEWRDTIFEVGTVSGEYYFSRQSQFGCDSMVNLVLIVQEIPQVQIIGDTLIGQGQSTMLVATYGAGNTYEWDNGIIGNILNVSPDTTTTYYLTVTNNLRCSNVFPITIHVSNGVADYVKDNVLTVYPNPTDGIINVNAGNLLINTIELYDIQGALIQVNTINDFQGLIDYSTVAPGIYMLKAKFENNTVTAKRLIIR